MQETVRRYRSRSRYVGSPSADLSWQQRIRGIRNPREYVSDTALRRSRMTFGISLPEMGADMRPVYDGTARCATRRNALAAQRQASAERVIPAVSKTGARGTVAAAGLLVLALILLIIWCGGRAELNRERGRIRETETRINSISSQCESLQRQVETRTAEIDVVYSAVGRGMISAQGTRSINIEVSGDAVIRPADTLGR